MKSWYLLSRGCLRAQPPIQTLSTESLKSFSGTRISHVLSQLVAGGIKWEPCESTGEDFCKHPPGFLLALSRVSFPLADFALWPFPVVNRSFKYDCVLCPVSPPCESSNLAKVLETPNIVVAAVRFTGMTLTL